MRLKKKQVTVLRTTTRPILIWGSYDMENWREISIECIRKSWWLFMFDLDRSSHRRHSIKKGFLKSFAKFTGKRLCQSLFFNKVGIRVAKKKRGEGSWYKNILAKELIGSSGFQKVINKPFYQTHFLKVKKLWLKTLEK